jgi:hypothetical protein
MNRIKQHANFESWQPLAKIIFKMALDCDHDGARRFLELQEAQKAVLMLQNVDVGGGDMLTPATAAFNKTHAGKLYRAITLEYKMPFSI